MLCTHHHPQDQHQQILIHHQQCTPSIQRLLEIPWRHHRFKTKQEWALFWHRSKSPASARTHTENSARSPSEMQIHRIQGTCKTSTSMRLYSLERPYRQKLVSSKRSRITLPASSTRSMTGTPVWLHWRKTSTGPHYSSVATSLTSLCGIKFILAWWP